MKSSETITLGVGDLSVNGEDVGYLAGSVTHTTEIETKEFRHGTHQTLVKAVTTTLSRTIKASLAQIDINTLKLALGIGQQSHINGNDRLNFGNNWEIPTLTNVKFVHTRDDGKKVTIFMPKAQVVPDSSDLEFTADDFLSQAITIKAVEDLSRPDCPLGFIQVGSSDDTSAPSNNGTGSGSGGNDNSGGGNGEGGNGGNGGTQATTVAVTDESVSGEAEETWYNYQLAHGNVVEDPAPVVKSEDGNTTYTENADYIVDYTNGMITTNECGSTTLTGGATIKVSYSYSGSQASSSGNDGNNGGESGSEP